MSALVEWFGQLFGVEWTRPLAFIGLILALLVLLAGVVRERPIERPIGTTRLWRELLEQRSAANPKASARKRRRFPLHLWILSLAILLAVVAMAGPEPLQLPVERRFTVYLDDSPSMRLAWNDGEQSRAEVALEAFERWRESLGDADLSWEMREGLPGSGGRPGDIVVTDHADPWLESPVGLFASGGGLVPGMIGQGVDEEAQPIAFVLDTDGEVVTELLPARFEVVWGGQLPRALRSVYEAWAEERGFSCVEASREPEGCLLSLTGRAPDAGVNSASAEGGHEGWFARGPYAELSPSRTANAVDWVVGSETGVSLVRFVTGEIEVAWTSWSSRKGADAEFALSWARLFDRVVRSPSSVASAVERGDAGEALERAPRREEARAVLAIQQKRSFPLEFLFATAAFVLAAIAGGIRARH